MWNDVFNIALTNGIFACLFVALLVYVLKDSRKREAKYQHIIENLSNKLNTIEEIKHDVSDIKESLNSPKKRRANEKTNQIV